MEVQGIGGLSATLELMRHSAPMPCREPAAQYAGQRSNHALGILALARVFRDPTALGVASDIEKQVE